MKILFILDHFHPYIGWWETLFYELTQWLVNQWHEVVVITSHYDPKLPQQESINWVITKRVWSNRINFQWYSIWSSIKELQKWWYDLIHGSTYFSIIPTWIVSKRTWIKSVLTIHEIYGRLRYQFVWWMWWINYFYEWCSLTLLSFDQYICVSNYTKNCMRVMYWIPDHKLQTVYNGIDYGFWNPERVNPENIQKIKQQYNIEENYIGLYFGRMWVAKGMDDVLKAIPEIIKTIPHYKQVFITPKKQSSRILWVKNTFSVKEVEDFIKKNDLQKNIIRIESVTRELLRDWIKTVNLVILPSRAEWFGFAVSEVCALWTDLITTNVASIPEVVYGNINFVEPANSQDISQKVIDFYHDKHKIIEDKRFERQECIKKTIHIYKYIVGKWK